MSETQMNFDPALMQNPRYIDGCSIQSVCNFMY